MIAGEGVVERLQPKQSESVVHEAQRAAFDADSAAHALLGGGDISGGSDFDSNAPGSASTALLNEGRIHERLQPQSVVHEAQRAALNVDSAAHALLGGSSSSAIANTTAPGSASAASLDEGRVPASATGSGEGSLALTPSLSTTTLDARTYCGPVHGGSSNGPAVLDEDSSLGLKLSAEEVLAMSDAAIEDRLSEHLQRLTVAHGIK